MQVKRNVPVPDLNIGETVVLNSLFPGIDKSEIVNGTIRNVKKNRNQLRLGIQFKELSKTTFSGIQNYLNSLLNLTI